MEAGAGEVGDLPGGGDPPDRAVAVVGEPQRPVGSDRDPVRLADTRVGVGGDGPGSGDPPDRVVAVVGEPQGPVGPGHDPDRVVDAGVSVDRYRPGRSQDNCGADRQAEGQDQQSDQYGMSIKFFHR